jgi:hypothetical protein
MEISQVTAKIAELTEAPTEKGLLFYPLPVVTPPGHHRLSSKGVHSSSY